MVRARARSTVFRRSVPACLCLASPPLQARPSRERAGSVGGGTARARCFCERPTAPSNHSQCAQGCSAAPRHSPCRCSSRPAWATSSSTSSSTSAPRRARTSSSSASAPRPLPPARARPPSLAAAAAAWSALAEPQGRQQRLGSAHSLRALTALLARRGAPHHRPAHARAEANAHRLTAAAARRIKQYHNCIFHTVQRGFIVQTGDPTNTGKGGTSIFGCRRAQGLQQCVTQSWRGAEPPCACRMLFGEQARLFESEIHPHLRHARKGMVAMASGQKDQNASQFYLSLIHI